MIIKYTSTYLSLSNERNTVFFVNKSLVMTFIRLGFHALVVHILYQRKMVGHVAVQRNMAVS